MTPQFFELTIQHVLQEKILPIIYPSWVTGLLINVTQTFECVDYRNAKTLCRKLMSNWQLNSINMRGGNLSIGVPQDSILRPNLFIIYPHLRWSLAYSFADYTIPTITQAVGCRVLKYSMIAQNEVEIDDWTECVTVVFECMDHIILLWKLESYNLLHESTETLRYYFENWCQIDRCGVSTCVKVDLIIGAPQGSILRPVLYIIYANDIPQVKFGLLFLLMMPHRVLDSHI